MAKNWYMPPFGVILVEIPIIGVFLLVRGKKFF
jgi:hypothetical protein